MTIYLYVKTHNKTGFKYLGKTIKKDPHTYTGSGKHWVRHLKKHGYDYSTEILKECQDTNELAYWGLYYSELWNVVESTEWANLKPEKGDGGAGFYHTEETRAQMSQKHIGKTHSDQSKEKMKGRKLSDETKAKIGSASKKRMESAEYRNMLLNSRKISQSKNGYKISPEGCANISKGKLGKKRKPFSEETKAKMRESWKRRKNVTNES
jgi:hypothetical protein